MNEKFIWSDAWILLAIIYSGGRKGGDADLAHVIQAADFINHAIPTDEEIQGALNRLGRANLIQETAGNYKVSTVVLEAYARTTTPRRSVHKELQDMERLLNVEKS